MHDIMNNKNSEIKIFLSNKKNNINNSGLFAIVNKLVYDEIKIKILENEHITDISRLRLLIDLKQSNSKINKAIFNSVANFKFGLISTLREASLNNDFIEKNIFINENELNQNSEIIEFTKDFWNLFIDELYNSKTNKELIIKIV